MMVGLQLADCTRRGRLHLAHWAGPAEYEPLCTNVGRVRWRTHDEALPSWLADTDAQPEVHVLREADEPASWRRTGGRWVLLWWQLADAPAGLQLCSRCLARHLAEHAKVAERLAACG